MELLSHLKQHRARVGLTQQELAQRVGVRRQTILAIEKGHYVPSTLLALRIAREGVKKGSFVMVAGYPSKTYRSLVAAEMEERVERWFPGRARLLKIWHDMMVAAGDGELGADGSLAIGFTPEADERRTEEGITYRYRLSVDVTDEGGETRSAERVFRLGFVAVEARSELECGFLDAGEAGSSRWRVERAGRSWALTDGRRRVPIEPPRARAVAGRAPPLRQPDAALLAAWSDVDC